MSVLECILCSFLILCAIAVCLSRNLLVAVIIQMAYSMIMSVIWIILQSRTWPSRKQLSEPASPAFFS